MSAKSSYGPVGSRRQGKTRFDNLSPDSPKKRLRKRFSRYGRTERQTTETELRIAEKRLHAPPNRTGALRKSAGSGSHD